MKAYFALLPALLFGLILSFAVAPVVSDAASFSPRSRFVHTSYLKYGGTSTTCLNPQDACPFSDRDLWAIPAGTVIEKVYIIIDTAITGTTALTVGDDDGATSFIADVVAGFATPGLYGWDAKTAGAYLRIQTAGGTDAADIYVVPSAKFYSATGKEVKLDVTTANTAGKARVFVEGYYIGAPNF